MGIVGLIIGVIGLVLALASFAYTRHQARKSARSRLRLNLGCAFDLDPSKFQPDLSNVLGLSFNNQTVSNFVCLQLTVTLDGYVDLHDDAARQPPGPREPTRPKMLFQNLRILAVGTVDNDPNTFVIPLVRADHDASIFVNMVHMKAGASATFNILGTKPDRAAGIAAELSPGYVRQADVVPEGMLVDAERA